MAFVQNLGAKINPYTSYLPRGMQQSAQQQAGRQFLGGLAAPFLAAAGPSRYPMPTVAGLAGINPAIQSAQQTQNVALQNAMNAQKLQMLQNRQNLLAQISGGQPTPRPTVNLAPSAALPIPPQLANTPQRGPSMTAYNTAMQQRAATPMAEPVNMFQAGAPNYKRLGLQLIAAGDAVTGKALMEMGKGTTAMQNAAAIGLRPGTPKYNQYMQNVTNPAARYEPSSVTGAVKANMGVFNALNENVARAGQTNRLLNLQKQLFESQDPEAFGPGSALVQSTKDLLRTYGLKNVADRLGATPGSAVAKSLEAIATEITFDTTGKLKGAISEKELGLAGEVASRITDTKNAALANIEIRLAMNKKAVMIARSINRDLAKLPPAEKRRLIENDPQALTLMVERAGLAPENDISADIEQIIVKYGGGRQTNTGGGGGPVPAGTTGSGD